MPVHITAFLSQYSDQVSVRDIYPNCPNKEKPLFAKKKRLFVVPAGIEPATQGFSVLCSTN